MGYLNEDGLATLVGKVKGQVVQLTAAEYRQIPAETKNTDNKIYFVEDDDYAYAIDNEPTLNSENLVKSGGVYNYTSKIGTGALTTTAQTLIPAVNELNNLATTLDARTGWIATSRIYQYYSKAIAADTNTLIGSFTLPDSGIWLITCHITVNTANEGILVCLINNQVVRGNGKNGGGVANVLIGNFAANDTIRIAAANVVACTASAAVNAVRLR